jgi:predicted Fe-Mo cluster-binding NifX family protein
MISKNKAEILLTGFCGPNAFKALNAAKIGVANNAGGSVRDAVAAFIDGNMPLTDEANVEDQW